MADIRHMDALSEELGTKKAARELIKLADARTYGDYYDHGAVRALQSEPKSSNIDRVKKNLFTLSPWEGMGAIQHLCNESGLDLVRHVYNGQNAITVRNAGGRRRHAKVYTTARMTSRAAKRSSFTITGYRYEEAPRYYMLLCFEGPVAWVVKRRDMLKIHDEVKANGFIDDGTGGYGIPARGWDHEGGVMTLNLGIESHSKLLFSAKRFDL